MDAKSETNWRALAEQLYQAAWFAEPFVKFAVENAPNPSLADKCGDEVRTALAAYRAAAAKEPT